MGVESVVRRGWTRLLGLGLVIVASSYAFDSNWPVPLGDRRLATPRSAAPVGALRVERAPGGACAFTWIRGVPSGPWRLVLLDAQRRELAWSPPLEGGRYQADGEFDGVLRGGRVAFWYAVADCAGRQSRTPTRALPAVEPVTPPR